ncbi:MAG TPA: PQQ-dependent sugar dehydrogenase [Pyrinomonadaceae bacterium]|nr:PQQ-dependent sugar dehydrogenase [Pyrinomonadaceae bacterium]
MQFFRITAIVLILVSTTYAATLPAGFIETQISGLSNPTAMEIAPDGRIFVCLQGGSLRVIKNGTLLPAPFLTLNVDPAGERGLLGIAFDPNFATNNFLYLYYTVPIDPRHNRVSRFTANGDVVVPGSETIILELENLTSAQNHNGGAIHFGPDGKLYVAVGENATASNAQTLSNRLGKMLRINADGSIPTDNPFFNQAVGNNRSIWALGLRNPFTFSFQPGVGRMFINDVGESTWEEINDGIAGSNYGWRTCEGACDPPNANLRDPIFAYRNDTSTCAITGGTFYNPPAVQFPDTFVGKYLFSDLCGGWIRVFDPATGTASDFASGISLPVDLKVGADGSLYYLSRGSASVFRVQFTEPVLISEPNTDSAVALDSVTLVRDPFSISNPFNFSTDLRTRLMLFGMNLDLAPGENTSAVTARLEDAAQNVFPLTVEFVGKVPGFDLTEIVVRLPDNTPLNQTLNVSVTLRGKTSNKVKVRMK